MTARPQQLGECAPPVAGGLRLVSKRDTVGVDVLSQQRDLEDTLVDQGLDLGEHVTGPAIHLLARSAGGTMQNVQVLLQPTEMETQAA